MILQNICINENRESKFYFYAQKYRSIILEQYQSEIINMHIRHKNEMCFELISTCTINLRATIFNAIYNTDVMRGTQCKS